MTWWRPARRRSLPLTLSIMERTPSQLQHRIVGDDMQCVEVTLAPHETVIAEAGSLMMMDDGITMRTVFGDGRSDQGLLGKLMGAGKRVLTGESLSMSTYTNSTHTPRTAWFAAPYPGKIMPLDLAAHQGQLICQKDSFLCASQDVRIGIAFQKRIGAGLVGAAGLLMHALEGSRPAVVHAGCLVALTRTVDYDIQFVGGIRNTLFGGEGLFFAQLRGPGRVWIQSLPFSRLADTIIAAAPKAGGKGREEGSILGGLGRLLDG